MAQKIMLTEELRRAMVEEFTRQLADLRVTSQTFVYTQKLTGYTEHANLIYSGVAWAKQRMLVEAVDKEIAWYGLMERREDADVPTYYVKDIVVYPQKTTATTVDVDDEIYPEWYGNQPDEFYTEMRLQGHSHVNMATSPSGTDREHWDELIKKVPADSFFVCIICNKKLEHFVNIFDFRRNTKYDTSDVTISIEGFKISEFLQDAKTKLTSIPTYSSVNGAGKNYSGWSGGGKTYGSSYQSALVDPYTDDYDDPYDYYHSPAYSGRSVPSTPPKTSPKTGSKSSAPVAPAPKANIPSITSAAYLSKFGKRG
ncbi:MAG: hypothetical protein PUF04_09620 [bacterium]|nr:hypothetical protein [bacterium]